MATLKQLYTRIILDIDRDDMGTGQALDQAKIDAVADAIAQYKMEAFWFNRASGSGNTSADDATLAMPSGVFVPNVVAYDGEALVRVPLHEIEHRTDCAGHAAAGRHETPFRRVHYAPSAPSGGQFPVS